MFTNKYEIDAMKKINAWVHKLCEEVFKKYILKLFFYSLSIYFLLLNESTDGM